MTFIDELLGDEPVEEPYTVEDYALLGLSIATLAIGGLGVLNVAAHVLGAVL